MPIYQQFARDDSKHGGKTLNQRASSRQDKARKSTIECIAKLNRRAFRRSGAVDLGRYFESDAGRFIDDVAVPSYQKPRFSLSDVVKSVVVMVSLLVGKAIGLARGRRGRADRSEGNSKSRTPALSSHSAQNRVSFSASRRRRPLSPFGRGGGVRESADIEKGRLNSNEGMKPERLAALVADLKRNDLTAEESVAFDLAYELVRGGTLPEPLFRLAVNTFGQHGTNEMIYLVGLYSMVSTTLNGFNVPVPERE